MSHALSDATREQLRQLPPQGREELAATRRTLLLPGHHDPAIVNPAVVEGYAQALEAGGLDVDVMVAPPRLRHFGWDYMLPGRETAARICKVGSIVVVNACYEVQPDGTVIGDSIDGFAMSVLQQVQLLSVLTRPFYSEGRPYVKNGETARLTEKFGAPFGGDAISIHYFTEVVEPLEGSGDASRVLRGALNSWARRWGYPDGYETSLASELPDDYNAYGEQPAYAAYTAPPSPPALAHNPSQAQQGEQ